jgi:hypothetical protein
MALTYRGVSATPVNLSSGSGNVSPTLPSGWENNEIAFMLVALGYATLPAITSVTSGWNLIGATAYGTTKKFWLYSRLLQTGDSDPVIALAQTGNVYATIACFYGGSGDIDASSQTSWILASSNTAYQTDNTTLRAAGFELSEAAPLIFLGAMYAAASRTFTAPTGYTERLDTGSTTGRAWVNINQKDSDHAAGTVSAVDATISTTDVEKHAWLVAVKKGAAGGTTVPVHLLKSRYYPQGVIR